MFWLKAREMTISMRSGTKSAASRVALAVAALAGGLGQAAATPAPAGKLDAMSIDLFTRLREKIGQYEPPGSRYILMERVHFDDHKSFPNKIWECVTSDARLDGKSGPVTKPQAIASIFGFPHSPTVQGADNFAHLAQVSFVGDIHFTIEEALRQAGPYQATELLGSCPLKTEYRTALYIVTTAGPLAPVLVAYECAYPQGMPGGKTTVAGNNLASIINTPPSACAAIPNGDFSGLPLAPPTN
jgi:hypothetical protein